MGILSKVMPANRISHRRIIGSFILRCRVCCTVWTGLFFLPRASNVIKNQSNNSNFYLICCGDCRFFCFLVCMSKLASDSIKPIYGELGFKCGRIIVFFLYINLKEKFEWIRWQEIWYKKTSYFLPSSKFRTMNGESW